MNINIDCTFIYINLNPDNCGPVVAWSPKGHGLELWLSQTKTSLDYTYEYLYWTTEKNISLDDWYLHWTTAKNVTIDNWYLHQTTAKNITLQRILPLITGTSINQQQRLCPCIIKQQIFISFISLLVICISAVRDKGTLKHFTHVIFNINLHYDSASVLSFVPE